MWPEGRLIWLLPTLSWPEGCRQLSQGWKTKLTMAAPAAACHCCFFVSAWSPPQNMSATACACVEVRSLPPLPLLFPKELSWEKGSWQLVRNTDTGSLIAQLYNQYCSTSTIWKCVHVMDSMDLDIFWLDWFLLNDCWCSLDPTQRTEHCSPLLVRQLPSRSRPGRGKGDKDMCVWVSLFAQPSPFPIKALQPQAPGSQTFTMWPFFGVHALLLVAVILSPVTAAAWSENDVTGEDVYPPLWDLAPENLLDFPVKDNKIVINAWNYPDRLGVYKSLLNASAKYFGAFGPQNSGNILWGLPLQHGWQYHTGMNYFLKMLD